MKLRFFLFFFFGLLADTVVRADVPRTLTATLPTTVYVAGDIAQCDHDARDAVSSRTAKLIPDGAIVITLGDSVYPLATKKYLQSCYAPTWGRHLDHTIAVPGNHDYANGKLTDFAEYFGSHTDPNGYFARRIGNWLLIGLNSNQSSARLAEQFAWLKQTLSEQREDVKCIAAFWHHALFSSGPHAGDGDRMRPAWQMLYDAHADIVMSGHEHFYERFEALNAKGVRDAGGIREFVVGTGGGTLYGFYRPTTRSSVRRAEHGVLALGLQQSGYSFEFHTVGGEVFDGGVGACHTKDFGAK